MITAGKVLTVPIGDERDVLEQPCCGDVRPDGDDFAPLTELDVAITDPEGIFSMDHGPHSCILLSLPEVVGKLICADDKVSGLSVQFLAI